MSQSNENLSFETPETHECPLDTIDYIQREKAIRNGHIAIADEIDADTLERHASCITSGEPGRNLCARMALLLESEESEFDASDDVAELFS
jgi:hypothetical protein